MSNSCGCLFLDLAKAQQRLAMVCLGQRSGKPSTVVCHAMPSGGGRSLHSRAADANCPKRTRSAWPALAKAHAVIEISMKRPELPGKQQNHATSSTADFHFHRFSMFDPVADFCWLSEAVLSNLP